MMTQHDDIGGGWVGLVGLFGQMDLVGLVGLVIAGPLNDDPTLVIGLPTHFLGFGNLNCDCWASE